MTDVHVLALAVVWTWLGLLAASQIRCRTWTLPGLDQAFSYREALPPPSAFSMRFDRIAGNMLENLPLFIGALCAAHFAGVPSSRLTGPAWLFLGARVAYTLVGAAGVKYLRSALWAVSLVGIAQILATLL